jgi:hypothetical protein
MQGRGRRTVCGATANSRSPLGCLRSSTDYDGIPCYYVRRGDGLSERAGAGGDIFSHIRLNWATVRSYKVVSPRSRVRYPYFRVCMVYQIIPYRKQNPLLFLREKWSIGRVFYNIQLVPRPDSRAQQDFWCAKGASRKDYGACCDIPAGGGSDTSDLSTAPDDAVNSSVE